MNNDDRVLLHPINAAAAVALSLSLACVAEVSAPLAELRFRDRQAPARRQRRNDRLVLH